MKIFLDTNVLVSVLLWKGEAFTFVSKAVERGDELLICPTTFVELSDILRRDFNATDEDRIEFLETAVKLCSLVFEKVNPPESSLSPNDAVILETASRHADVLVTYDKALLKFKTSFRVVLPKQAYSSAPEK